MSAWAWVGLGLVGGLGALARFYADGLVGATGGAFPLGTFAVNASGSALLGLLAGIALKGNLLEILGTGLLGAYTTFSTWMLETERLGEDGLLALAALNIVLSLVVGLGAVELGRLVGAAL